MHTDCEPVHSLPQSSCASCLPVFPISKQTPRFLTPCLWLQIPWISWLLKCNVKVTWQGSSVQYFISKIRWYSTCGDVGATSCYCCYIFSFMNTSPLFEKFGGTLRFSNFEYYQLGYYQISSRCLVKPRFLNPSLCPSVTTWIV